METPSVNRESTPSDSGYAPTSVIAEHYRVERELGRGGMATVYLCTDLRDESRVAIKVLRQELGSAVVIERFLREIAFASELDHPQIPKVLGSGVIDGVPYYVMTYIEGESLKKRLEREKQLPIADALKIICEVIEPTAYAHKRGIVHRDLKPDNILIAKDAVYVLDFGIARAIIESGADRLTSTGIGVGTPAYMSPEQALGDRTLDVRSDIYSLGCVIYEMIAGIPPFVGPTAQVIISRRFAAPPPPLSEVRDNVPESVEEAIGKALAKSPADRWSTVSDFGNALRASMSDTRRRFRTPTIEFRRQSLVRAAIGIALVAVTVAGILAWSHGHRPAFEKGQDALGSFDFATAQAELHTAVTTSGGDARAQLWLAQILMLRGTPTAVWKPYVRFAIEHRAELTPREQLRTAALAALSSGKYEEACVRLDSLSRMSQQSEVADPTATLTLAVCLEEDHSVLPDTSSPSGYSFRASYHLIDSLYQSLLEGNANNSSAYSAIVPRLERVLATDKGRVRQGFLQGRQRRLFLALPSVIADTLAYVPYALEPAGGMWRTRDVDGLRAAIDRNQQTLRGIASRWSELAPDDPDAHETLARVLESRGELDGNGGISALQQVIIARRLLAQRGATTDGVYLQQLRLATAEVRLNLRRYRFDLAGALADSVLAWSPPSTLEDSAQDAAAEALIGLAAVRGRASRVIALEQKYGLNSQRDVLPDGDPVTFPPRLAVDRIALLYHAAFGGPADSVRAAVTRLKRNVNSDLPPKDVSAWSAALLRHPLALAAPTVGPRPVTELGPTSDLFVSALAAFAGHNTRRARVLLDSLASMHGDYAPGEITMDVVFSETWLRAAIGDTVVAMRQLDNALSGMAISVSGLLPNPVSVAGLVRAMALRAELAGNAGNRGDARTWANAVYSLWGGGDYITAPTLDRIRRFR